MMQSNNCNVILYIMCNVCQLIHLLHTLHIFTILAVLSAAICLHKPIAWCFEEYSKCSFNEKVVFQPYLGLFPI